MRETVQSTISAYKLISPGQTVLVGVSGGPDSVALLHVLLTLSPSMGFKVAAAHLNHGIRGEDADRDQAFVEELCELLGVPLITRRADVPRLARENGWTLEQAGREVRYKFLRDCAKNLHAERIALAHHMDDQAESILLHLTRGTGLAGLVGMLPMREEIIRPLLFVRRSDVERYLTDEGIAYCVDATNLETGGTRNRLRLELVPYVESNINPAFVKTLCSMGELLLRDESYLQSIADEALEQTRREGGFDRESLNALPLPILTRALRAALREAGAAVDIERVHIERLIALLGGRTGAKLQLPGVDAYIDYTLLCFGQGVAELEYYETPFVLYGQTFTPLGSFMSEKAELPAGGFGETRFVAYMDAQSLEGAVVRLRRHGDRIHPMNAPGHKKLKEYFIDRKVARSDRGVPLICKKDEVLFLPGFCSAEATRVGKETQSIIRVTFTPKK